MKKEQILIKLHLFLSDSSLPPTCFSLTESVLPKNMGTGILKRYIFQDKGYDTEHTLFLTSFSRFKQLLSSYDFMKKNNFFYYTRKGNTYFDCLKLEKNFSISIILTSKSFIKHTPLFSVLPQRLQCELNHSSESQFNFNQNPEILSISSISLQNYLELQRKYLLETPSLEEITQKLFTDSNE